MQVDCVIDARVDCRHHERLSFNRESDMTNERFVHNGIDDVAVVLSAFRQTADGVQIFLGNSLIHTSIKTILHHREHGDLK